MGNPSGPKRSWKKSTESSKPEAAGKRSWQHGSAAAPEPGNRRASRRLMARIVALILLIGVVSGIIYVWKKFESSKQPGLIIVAHGDALNLNTPSNGYSVQGASQLEQWARLGNDRPITLPPDSHWQRKDHTAKDWLDWLIEEGRKAGEIAVFHFGMPGHADPDKGAYLLFIPSDATHPEARHRLYLSELFDRLKDLDKKQKKVLLFDCTQTDHSLIHGMVTNDFARGLKALEAKIASVENCFVISSSDENQRSWTSPELGMSIFEYYLLVGLQGNAKGTGNRPKISVKNLAEYLAISVQKWAQANRAAVQKPIFLPASKLAEADEVDMAVVPKVIPKEPQAHQRDQLLEVKVDWEKYYQLAQLSPGPEVVAPQHWKTYTALLLRLEEQLFTGAAPSEVERTRRRLDTLASTITELSKSPAWSTNDLLQDINNPAAKVREKEATLAKASSLFSSMWKAARGSPMIEEVQNWKKLIAETKDTPSVRRQLLPHGWRWVMEKFVEESDVDAAERVLGQLEDELRPSVRPADIHFLRMLARDTREQPWAAVREKKELLRHALLLRARAERLAWLGNDSPSAGMASHWVLVSRWILPILKNGDEQRRLGEDLLFDAHSSQWDKAATYFTQAEQFYADAASKIQAYVAACQLRDQVYAQLPYYGEWLATTPGPPVDQVVQCWGQTHILARMLLDNQAPEKNGILNQTNVVRKIMAELQTQLQKQVREEVRSATVPTARAFHDLSRLLSTPLFLECYEGPNQADKARAARDDRLALLRKLKDSSYRLFVQFEQAKNIGDTPALYRPDDYAEARLRLGHARLGDEVIPLIRAANLTPVVLNWSVDRRTAPQEQVANLLLVSNKLGVYWSVLPQLLAQSDEAKAALELFQTTGVLSTLPRGERWLAQAAQLERLFDPGTVAPSHKHNHMFATQLLRWFHTHRFLLAQAQRSLDEHWADLKLGDTDYSDKVAKLHLDAAQELLGAMSKEQSVEARGKGWQAYLTDMSNQLKAKPGTLQLTINAAEIPKVLPVTDEPYVKFAVGMKATGTPVPGFPVMRLWSPSASGASVSFTLYDKFVATSPGHFSRAMSSTSIPVDEELKWINSQAKVDLAASSAMLPLKAQLLHRGHLIEDASIQVAMVGPPRIRWKRDAPDNKQGLVVFGDNRLRDGHIHILFDTTHSMDETVRDLSIKKIDAARKALEEVLYQLPRDVTLSISTFRGIDGKKSIPSTKLIFPPKKWDDPSKYVQQILNALPTSDVFYKEFNDPNNKIETQTPITRGINETLFQDRQSPLFPIDENKPFTLLMLTDGVESEAGSSVHVAESIREDLLNCPLKQVICHLLLFSVDQKKLAEKPAEEKRFKEMLEINTEEYRKPFYKKQRTPPQLWTDINSVESLVMKLKDALRPQFTIIQNNEPVKGLSNQRVTLANEANWHQVFFGPGTYDLFTAGQVQKFRHAPGDRMAIKIERQSLSSQLVMASVADIFPPVPDALRRTSSGREVQFALLGQQRSNLSGGGVGLQLQVMMEPPVIRANREVALSRQRPRFAWFQLAPLLGDGKNAANNVYLTVSEHAHELASVWTLQASPWPAKTPGGNALASPAGYRLDSFWVKENLEPVASIQLPSLSPGMTEISAIGSVSIPGGGKLQDLMIRQRPGRSGDWLYIRCTHAAEKPLLIQLRPTSSLPGNTKRDISEEHRFFTSANSVSAWLDLASLAQEKELTLDIYSLSELVQQGEPKTIKLEYETNDASTPVDQLKSRRWNRD